MAFFIIYLVDYGLAFSGFGVHARPPGQRRCRHPPPQWTIGVFTVVFYGCSWWFQRRGPLERAAFETVFSGEGSVLG